MIRLKTRNNGSKLNSLLVVLIIALQGVVALSSSLFNPGEMNRESGYFSSFPGAHFSSNSTNFTFSNFSTIVKNVSTPSVRIQVNNSQEGLLIGSEKFAYSSDGSFPMNFGNPHDDNFSDGEFIRDTTAKFTPSVFQLNKLQTAQNSSRSEWTGKAKSL